MQGLKVVYEDNHLIGVYKPPGFLVHGDATEDKPLSDYVKEYIKIRYNKPGDVFLGVIHRIDRPVSGVVLFARTSKGLTRMNELFKKREIKKTYLAITRERPEPIEGKLEHLIAKDTSRNLAKIYETMSNRAKAQGAKKSILEYELIGEVEGHYLIKVNPITGRPHQIRVQLSSLGTPILGDIKYGFKKPNRDGSIHLHCYSMEFIHPVKKEPVKVTTEPPRNQFWRIFQSHYS
ncbi:MAG: RluA family pseudouridine synthase [Bacteroidota bacterium]